MKSRKGRRSGRSGRGAGDAAQEAATSVFDAGSQLGGLFYESEDDVVRRLMDRVHRGHALRAVSRL